ncbi:MAG: DUF3833 domain-containing protein [Halioglobus sp.]
MLKRIITVLALYLLCACSSVQVTDYAKFQPIIDPVIFFNGELWAHGVIKNRGNRVIRTFSAKINAYWKDGIGTLEEDFVFNDGEEQRRVWTLTPNKSGGYTGTADDVIGDGLLTLSGNSVFLDYVLRVPYGDSTIDLRVDDRMYLVSPEVLINESRMTKFGVTVGFIDLVIIRQPPSN